MQVAIQNAATLEEVHRLEQVLSGSVLHAAASAALPSDADAMEEYKT